ncbi:MAG: hypothetical protein HY288_20615 [Planctomycetia bacterium]|nr:hypothetical protein [Planctomycetia bacterium]
MLRWAGRSVGPRPLMLVAGLAGRLVFAPPIVAARQWGPPVLQSAQESDRRASAQILLPGGKPAAGVLVTVQDFQLADPQSDALHIDPRTTTDQEGRFSITSGQGLARVAVTVDAPWVVKQKIFQLQPGKQQNTLQLIERTTIRDRVLKRAKPVEGVTVGVVGLAPTHGDFAGIYEATTDRDGRFVVHNVYPDRASQRG